MFSRHHAMALIAGFAVTVAATYVRAQNPNYPGYLGVYVVEGYGGMQIASFIRHTPAADLAAQGEISRGDTIVRLGGRSTRSLSELRQARNRIPLDKEAKMILRDRRGDAYHVWISRSPPVAAYAPGAPAGAAPAPADTFRRGGRGEGDEGDFRDRSEGDEPRRNEDEGEFRDKRE